MRLHAKIARRLKGDVYDALVRAGLARYRMPWPVGTEVWDRDYGSGKLDQYGRLTERARYGVLGGYITAWRARPRLLDVGCGTAILRDRIGSSAADYTGIDPSAEAIAQARAKHGEDRFEVAGRPGAELGGFDIIVCNEMLYYVPDVNGLLGTLKGALNEGGWLLTSILRHPGDVALRRALTAQFHELDAVELRNEKTRHVWRIACHEVREG